MLTSCGEETEANRQNGRGGRPSCRSQLFEVAVFLFLVLPSLLLPYIAGAQTSAGFTFTAVGTVLHNLAYLALIAFFLWRNGEPKERIGWEGAGAGREIMLGFWLFLLMSFSASLIERLLSYAGFSLPSHPVPSSLIARTTAGYVLALVLVTVVAVSEETIFRGYLIMRLAAVTRSRMAAVLISTAIFSLGHGYEGLTGVVAVFFIGLFLAAVYLWRGSLIAPVVIHFLQDFVGLLGAAFSGRGHG